MSESTEEATDSNLDRVMRQIEELGVGTPEYHDALAFLLTVMAKRQWIIADQIRRSRRDSERRREAAAARPKVKREPDGEAVDCPECGRSVRTYVPRGGDGSLVLMRWHKVGLGMVCGGSKQEVTS